MKKELYLKYLNNQCADEEFEEVANWIESGGLEPSGKKWAEEDWHEYDAEKLSVDEKKYNFLLDKIHHAINLKSQVTYNSIEKKLTPFNWMLRVASILLIPTLAALLYLLSNQSFVADYYTDNTVDSLEIVAPAGGRTVIQLTDGTKINLNHGSRLKYPRNFEGNREVTLIGEGYFDVAHNPDKPFIVKAGSIDVKVLGTEFNVIAYPEDELISTTLVEGKVHLAKTKVGSKPVSIGTMVPGQNISYNTKTGKVTSSRVDVESHIAWKEGKIVFDNETVENIAKRLSRIYNVDFKVSGDAKDIKYTVTFIDESLEMILELMSKTGPIEYQIIPPKKGANNIVRKEQVIIKKRN